MAIEKRFTHRIDIMGADTKLIGTVTQGDRFANIVVIRLVEGVEEFDISGADYVTVTYLRNGNVVTVDATGDRVNITNYEKGEISIIIPDSVMIDRGYVIRTVSVYHVTGEEEAVKLTSGRFAFEVVEDLSQTLGVNVEISASDIRILDQIAAREAVRVSNEARRIENEVRIETAVDNAEEAVNLVNEALSTIGDLTEAYKNYNPSIKENEGNTPTDYRLDVKYTQDDTVFSYTTPNLKGDKGDPGDGDMLKSVYDTDDDGVVDNSEKLGGELPSHYVAATRTVNGHALTRDVTVARGDIVGIVLSDSSGTSKTLTMTLVGTVLTITYE